MPRMFFSSTQTTSLASRQPHWLQSIFATATAWLTYPSLAQKAAKARELLWSLLHGKGPPDLEGQLPPLQQQRVRSGYDLRRPWSITQPRPRTAQEASSWLYQAAAEWNWLPPLAQSASTLTGFKRLSSAALCKDKLMFGIP